MSNYNRYLIRCIECGRTTSKQHAKTHSGLCAPCVKPVSEAPTRNERILEHGYQAYALEEGHYDNGCE